MGRPTKKSSRTQRTSRRPRPAKLDPLRYTAENWWRHYLSYWLALGFPWNSEIESEYLSASNSPGAPPLLGVPEIVLSDAPPILRNLAENSQEHCAWVQRRASEHAVATLHHLGVHVTREMLRQFLYRLAFGNNPLAADIQAIANLLEEVKTTADPKLLESLPFPLPSPPERGPAVERDFGGVPVTVRPILAADFTMDIEESPIRTWNCEVIRILRVRIAHTRLVSMRTHYLELTKSKFLPSHRVYEAQLARMAQQAVEGSDPLPSTALECLMGSAAARSSAWWRDQMQWYLKRADSTLEPRGSYLSADAAPKQLFIWHEFDYWLRTALNDLPTHAHRNRAIAVTLATLAGPALYRPNDLEQFARNIVERWRTRKASRATEFSRAFLRDSLSPL